MFDAIILANFLDSPAGKNGTLVAFDMVEQLLVFYSKREEEALPSIFSFVVFFYCYYYGMKMQENKPFIPEAF